MNKKILLVSVVTLLLGTTTVMADNHRHNDGPQKPKKEVVHKDPKKDNKKDNKKDKVSKNHRPRGLPGLTSLAFLQHFKLPSTCCCLRICPPPPTPELVQRSLPLEVSARPPPPYNRTFFFLSIKNCDLILFIGGLLCLLSPCPP